MRFKGTLVLLVAVLALGGYIYFYEIKGGEKREKAKEAEKQIWKIDNRNIQQIDLIYPGQHIAAVRKNERVWALTAPRQLDADSDELNRMASSASNIQRDSVVEQNPTDLKKFGLNPPISSLRLKTKDGKEYALDFGNNNPTGSFTYASMPNQGGVFLVPSNFVETFSKKVDDLRNHSILSFEQPEAQSLTLNSPKGVLELTKDSNDRWWFKGTNKRAAESADVRGMLNALSLGKIKEFFNENPEDYSSLGLDKPFIDVSVICGKDKAVKHLIIGSEKSKLRKKGEKDAGKKGSAAEKTPSEIFLAKDTSRPDLFFVEKDLVDKLQKAPNDLRDKALVSMQRWDVDSILLKNSKGSFVFNKSGGEWFLGGNKKKAKWDAVNGILDVMEKPVKEWIDNPAALSSYGLDKPIIHVVLKQGSNELAECAFGRAAKNGVYAQVKGDPSVKIADPDGLALLDRNESDFAEPPAPSTPKK